MLPGTSGGGTLPPGYARAGRVVGREDLLETGESVLWSESRFTARAQVPHTTSAVEAVIRRRHLERLVRDHHLDLGSPVLDLGCADGTFAHALREIGFGSVVSTDILHSSVATLAESLDEDAHDEVLLIVDDMLQLPFAEPAFRTVIAWGVLSVTGAFDRALELAWNWLEPGGHLLLGEPLREQAAVYALVRGDVDEMTRVLDEGTRPAMWDKREERYRVNSHGFYEERLKELPAASLVERGGLSMLPSLVLGGVLEDHPAGPELRAALAERLADPALDEMTLWRQAFWLVRKG